jgi:AraC family L-rhamnose operon transcriptional activator RhaR/AraC family L-rhamnose operon regulatory protein RhaS
MSYRILRERTFFNEKNIHVRTIKRDPEIPYSLHSHEFYELVIVISGVGKHLMETESQVIGGGSAFLIPPDALHGYGEVENLVLYNILIGKDILSASLVDLSEIAGFKTLVVDASNPKPTLRLSESQIEEALAIIEKIQAENASLAFGKGTDTMTYAYLLQLLVMLSRSQQKPSQPKAFGAQRITSVIAYMEQNLNRPLSLRELCAQANMSASTLNRHFLLHTGWSPVEFHIRRRINYACSLIQTSHLSMESISEATGFSDGNYFARQFHTVMKMSPRQYKKTWNNKNSG